MHLSLAALQPRSRNETVSEKRSPAVSEAEAMHMHHRIDSETIASLTYSRAEQLMKWRMGPKVARSLALLEYKKRQVLARTAGTVETVRTRLQLLPDVVEGFACGQVIDGMLADTRKRFFHYFCLETKRASDRD
jgi:hypothetical protein